MEWIPAHLPPLHLAGPLHDMLDGTTLDATLLPSHTAVFTLRSVRYTHSGSGTSSCTYMCMATYTHVHTCPQANRRKDACSYEHSGATSPHPRPPPTQVAIIASLGYCAALLLVTDLGPAEGVARRAKSQGKCGPSWIPQTPLQLHLDQLTGPS